MSLLPVSAIPVVDTGYNINNSLRFRSSASATLSRTPSTAGNRSTWTWSAWIKRGRLTPSNGLGLFGSGTINSGSNETSIRFTAGDALGLGNYRVTTRLFRDPSTWYHIVVAFDTTQATGNNRVKMYVNGVEETSFSTLANPTLNSTADFINSTTTHYMGVSFATTSLYDDRYQAETYFIDGQALTPSSFGETDTTTGVWKPKAYTGTYGTNGFYLKFSDATIGTPTLINTTTAVQNTNSTTITVNVPAGTTNNDLMILLVCSGSGTNTWTTPSGWTLWSPTTNANGRAIYYRTASSEPASYTITQSGSTTSDAYILTYRNAAIDVMGTFPTSAANPAIAPSITTTENNAVVFFYIASPNVSSCTYTTPTNFTPLVSESDATTPSSAIFTRIQATAGATGTASSTASSGLPRAIQFSIKPASTNLGKDFSGNNNLWATNNISITSDVTYDSMTDSPTLTSATTANYAVLNPLDNRLVTITNANLNATSTTGGDHACRSTFWLTTGKWYWEVTRVAESITTDGNTVGVANASQSLTAGNVFNTSTNIWGMSLATGNKHGNAASVAYGSTIAVGSVVGIAYDADAQKIWFRNASGYFASGDPVAGTNAAFTNTTGATGVSPYVYKGATGSTIDYAHNFGQRAFSYTPPTGFNRLNTFNLPDSTIKKGNSYMDATLWTGTGVAQSITNAGSFKPDFVWVKQRSSTENHQLADTVRGYDKYLNSHLTDVEATNTNRVTSFNSNGFSIGTATSVNSNTNTYVGWQWQAGSSTVTNTSGTISAQVRANTTTGFSIVTYTGTGANATVGHGLGVAPKMVIVKDRSDAQNWAVYHSSLANTQFLLLNSSAAAATGATYWNSTSPTSTVFSIGTIQAVNKNTDSFVAYCWAEIAGFSNFGSYTGNGSADGPFVYTGFRPKFVMWKRTDSTTSANWWMEDSTRNTFNPTGLDLQANAANAEANNSPVLDFLSNGYKIRTTLAGTNASGSKYIYIAFAETPFKNSLAR